MASKGLQPYEIVRRKNREPTGRSDDVPRLLAPRPHDEPPPRLALTITPMGSFAAAALLVSALALAFTIGRLVPLTSRDSIRPTAGSLEEVYRRGPKDFNDLQVDRGTPD